MRVGAQVLGPFALLSQVHCQEAESELEWLRLELVPLWDVIVAGVSLTH